MKLKQGRMQHHIFKEISAGQNLHTRDAERSRLSLASAIFRGGKNPLLKLVRTNEGLRCVNAMFFLVMGNDYHLTPYEWFIK